MFYTGPRSIFRQILCTYFQGFDQRQTVYLSLILAGKIQALLATTKEQRREYKAKFVDMDVEFARMRERLDTMNLILDDIQVQPFCTFGLTFACTVG